MNWTTKAEWPKPGIEIIPPPKPKTSEIMRQNNLIADEAIKNCHVHVNVDKSSGSYASVGKFKIPETIKVIDEPDEVECIVIEDLGVYNKQGIWHVLHLPTLMRFDKAVPHVDPPLEKLLVWCKLVQSDHREDWEALKQFGTDIDKDETIELRQRVLRHCHMVDL
jgi:hypothetical protein